MKTQAVLYFCMMLVIPAFSNLSGSDDFNDNIRNSNFWLVVSDHLHETNGRLEYQTSSSGDQQGVWAWNLNTGSYGYNWTTTVNVVNNFNESLVTDAEALIGLAVIDTYNADSNSFIFGLTAGNNGTAYRGIYCGAQADGEPELETHRASAATNLTLRIIYDAESKTLTPGYSSGSVYQTLTNFNIEAWNMSAFDSFHVAVLGTSDDTAIAAGLLYADNFVTASEQEPADRHHMFSASLDYTHKSGIPNAMGDEFFYFAMEAVTDRLITNLHVQCPGGYSFNAATEEPGGRTSWSRSRSEHYNFFSQLGDGNYTFTLSANDGSQHVHVIPYMQEDGTTPIPSMINRPWFTEPQSLHNELFIYPGPVAFTWTNSNPDNGNAYEIEFSESNSDRWFGYYFTDEVDHPFFSPIAGPLSTRTITGLSFAPGTWEVELESNFDVFGSTSEQVYFGISKRAEIVYTFSVLDPLGDYDGDGLPNAWEAQYFSGPTNAQASDDPDTDGQDNAQEFIAGMDPTNSLSVFKITNCAPMGSDFVIEWPTVSGRVYSTYWSTNLTHSFHTLQSEINYPRNSSSDVMHNAQTECFYRIDVHMK